ncbi:MAG: type II CRISPR RNA-guided endonuclease Cas9 [Gammaproteobacteria bacterium]|nr:type II CRISPR RNA-guided endonuclease Cas9 [Gammaproteobacteria bacterium]
MQIDYRLGLDLGTNSIGWCMYRLGDDGEPVAIHRLGVRIFEDGRDPKTLASRAADRRLARQMRRRRDRVLKRRQRLLEGLTRFGLFPADTASRKALQLQDPYVLRAQALDQPISLHEIGRCLFHLGRKRGFRSSRKDSRSAETAKESGKISAAIARLRDELAQTGCRTVGEYLAGLHAAGRPVKARRRPDGEYVLYLQRAMVADEFDQIWASQERFHGAALSAEAREYLRDTLLFQRKLRPVQPGRCQFERSEFREPLASPLQQRFRVLQELNNLRLETTTETRPLTKDERDACLLALSEAPKTVTFSQLRSIIGVKRAARFTLESDSKRKGLKPDAVTSQFRAILADHWDALGSDRQRELALLVEGEDDAGKLDNLLRAEPWGFSGETAEALGRISLPEGYGSLSRKALERIVPELEREVVTFDLAVERAGYGSHSISAVERLSRLPYYGRILTGYTSPMPTSRVPDEREYGRIANPTVHIGLNQLRLLINEMIRRFGPPREVIVELARDMGLSGKRRRELMSEQKENQEANESLDAELERLGQRANHENRLRLRLYRYLKERDPLGARCVYTGEVISVARLFSAAVEVDHILPFSRSLHDGVGNKLLCTQQANRDKGNRTPYESFGHSPSGYDWEEILQRAEQLLDARQFRLFQPDALETFLGDRNFLDRQLTDTQYFSRVAREYLTAICDPGRVWVTSGRLTGLVRGKYGLNSILSSDRGKNRDDHRHHAVDAAVVGIASRSLIKRIADAAARAEQMGQNRALERLDLPWPSFRFDLAACLERVVISHRPDRGVEGQLHNATNYGLRSQPETPRDLPVVHHRVPVDSLDRKKAAAIADHHLRSEILAAIGDKTSVAETREALAQFSAHTGIRRARVEERLSVIPIRRRDTREPYRWVKGDDNYCYEVTAGKNGKWGGRVIQRFHANQPSGRDNDHTADPVLFRIMRGDMLAIGEGERRRIMRVTQLSPGKIRLAEHKEANVDARSRSKDDDFDYLTCAPSTLQTMRARLVGVDVLGYVNDPGFRHDRSNRGDRK